MANRTNSSEYFWSYEYYWDYIDPIPVDGSKLMVNKLGEQWVTSSNENTKGNNSTADSIVIAFWVGLAAFVMFLFLVLLCMSCSGSTPAKQVVVGSQREESSSNGEQPHCDDLRSSYSDMVP